MHRPFSKHAFWQLVRDTEPLYRYGGFSDRPLTALASASTATSFHVPEDAGEKVGMSRLGTGGRV
jgi:hypothetical protein